MKVTVPLSWRRRCISGAEGRSENVHGARWWTALAESATGLARAIDARERIVRRLKSILVDLIDLIDLIVKRMSKYLTCLLKEWTGL